MAKLAANLSTLFTDQPLADRFATAAAAGFGAAELQFPYQESTQDLGRALLDSGLSLVLINAPAGDLARGERGLALAGGMRFRDAIDLSIEYARVLNCAQIHVLIGRTDRFLQGALLREVAQTLTWAARRMQDHDRLLLLEALNEIDHPGYALPSLAAAEALRSEIGMANVALQFDAYHASRSGNDPLDAWSAFRSSICHVQIAHPRDRGEPDDAGTAALLRTLDAAGYDGHVGCEYRPRADTLAGLTWARPYGVVPRAKVQR